MSEYARLETLLHGLLQDQAGLSLTHPGYGRCVARIASVEHELAVLNQDDQSIGYVPGDNDEGIAF